MATACCVPSGSSNGKRRRDQGQDSPEGDSEQDLRGAAAGGQLRSLDAERDSALRGKHKSRDDERNRAQSHDSGDV